MEKRSVYGKVLGEVFGLVFCVLLIFIAERMTVGQIGFARSIVVFLHAQLVVLVLMGLLFFIGDLFFDFIYPFSLISPLGNAGASYFLAGFVIDLLIVINATLTHTLLSGLLHDRGILMWIVFFIALLTGYITLFIRRKHAGETEKKKITRVSATRSARTRKKKR